MHTTFHEKFVINRNGKRTAVILEMKEYTKMLSLLEEARVLKIVQEGEKEYREGKLKSISSVSELDK